MFNKKNVQNIYALTPIQESMLFYSIFKKDSQAYFEQSFYHITGELNIQLLEDSWNYLIQRHDVLRTLFIFKKVPQPLQIVLKKRPFSLSEENLSHLTEDKQKEHCDLYRESDRNTPFDLSKDPLMRLKVFKLEEQSYNVVWSIHHILLDGWSLGIIYGELFSVYNDLNHNREPQLTPAQPFNQYINWLNKRDKTKSIEYWGKYLESYEEPAGLPRIDPKADSGEAFKPERTQFSLSAQTSALLRECAIKEQVTYNTMIQSLWGVLLFEYNQLADVVFSSTVSGRPPEVPGVDQIVGLFINTIPVRIQKKKGETFSQLLKKVQLQGAQAMDHHYTSVDDMLAQSLLKNKLFDHILIFENYPDLAGRQFNPEENPFKVDHFEQFELTSFDLSLQFTPGEKLEVHVVYNPAVFSKEVIASLETHLDFLANRFAKNPNSEICDLDLLSPELSEFYLASKPLALGTQEVLKARVCEYVPPENEAQEILVALWKEVLKNESIGIDDNFFECGGHSLLAIRIVSGIFKRLSKEVSLTEFFSHPDIRSLEAFIRLGSTAAEVKSIPALPDADSYASSHAQKRLWVLDQIHKNNTAYNHPSAYILEGNLDFEAFKKSFESLLERHESLRTTFKEVEGVPYQVVHPPSFIQLKIHELGDLAEPELKAYLCKESEFCFDLQKGPLLHASLGRLSDEKFVLLLNMHHIICDGWSLGVFVEDAMKYYRHYALGHQTLPEPLEIQYRDFSAWHNATLEQENLSTRQYWLNKLSGDLPSLDFPSDYPRPKVQTYKGHTLSFKLPPSLMAKVDTYCRQQQVTRFMMLQANLKILLSKMTGQSDLIVGTPATGRTHPQLQNQFGFYANTLALRDQLEEKSSFTQFVSQVKTSTLEAYSAQDYPFDRLVDELKVFRDISRNPIFDIMMICQDNLDSKPQGEDLKIRMLDFEPQSSRFDLVFDCVSEANGGGMIVNLVYNTDLYKNTRIEQVFTNFKNLLTNLLEKPESPISEINLLSEEQKYQLISEATLALSVPKNTQSIIDLFERSVNKFPEHIAIRGVGKEMSYLELDETANHLAHELVQNHSVQAGDVVACLLPRGQNILVSLLAILKTGATYLPIDEAYPSSRIEFIVKNSRCSLILCEKEKAEFANLKDLSVPFFNLQPTASSSLKERPTRKKLGHPAYIIYTSGTTGQPKGVVVEDASFVQMILSQIEGFGITPKDRCLLFASPSFDASLSETFLALLSGASCVPSHKSTVLDLADFSKWMNEYEVSVATFPPSYLSMLAREGLPFLKTIISAGEPALVADALYYAKHKEYFNAYGPTETSVCASFHQVDANNPYSHNIPIGKALPGTCIHILDKNLHPVPQGVLGEICISGNGVSRGYLRRPELDREKFIPHPFIDNCTMYRSGDLGYFSQEGELYFSGRLDSQLKVRGFRVEAEEIENELLKQSAISQVAVVLSRETQLLNAFIVAEKDLSSEFLQDQLSQNLPEYMLPNQYIFEDELPLNPSGKIDRKILSSRELTSKIASTVGAENALPLSQNERQLRNLWSSLLGHEHIDINDNFFEIGGHSLKGIQLMSRIQKEFSKKIPLSQLFLSPTIKQLAKYLGNKKANDLSNGGILLPLSHRTDKPKIFMFPGITGYSVSLQGLAKELEHSYSLFGLEPPGLDGTSPTVKDIRSLCSLYAEQILLQQKEGSFILIGHSIGGWLACETAKILCERDRTISRIVLIDSVNPEQLGQDSEEASSELLREMNQNFKTNITLPKKFTGQLSEMKPMIREGLIETGALSADSDDTFIQGLLNVLESGLSYHLKVSDFAVDRMLLLRSQVTAKRLLLKDNAKLWNLKPEINFCTESVEADHISILASPQVEVIASKILAHLSQDLVSS